MPRLTLALAAAVLLLAATATVFSADSASRFPSSDPNPRVGTPNDPNFDCAESDDEDTSAPKCSDVFAEQFKLFGFAPDASENTALYHDPAHLAAGQRSQVSGVSADLAWKTTIGRPDVAIAILDTGIRWDRTSLRLRIWLNRRELPLPQYGDGRTATAYDANGDGAFNVADYDQDPRVNKDAGPDGIAGAVDGQDMIRAFSNGTDADGNGYVDDIAGWDWFDDDNDPFDASSYSSANNHGSGRAEDAAQETNDGLGGAGVCPLCQIMVMRVWDTFVAPGDNYAMATLYAADNGASVQEVALGVLQNSRFSQAATEYAFHKGVALMQVSSDLNTSSHNFPTDYNNTIFVAGSVADTHGVGNNQPALADFLRRFGIGGGTNAVSTWFRNSNTTQFGGHAHIVMMGDTGSQATGQAAGAAGLVASRGLELASQTGGRLTSNEIKQILTTTAEDVLPENTVGTGIPDPSQPGWDQHFGYGRVNLAAAVNRIGAGRIPPEAGLESPAWFAPLDPVATPTVPISGYVSARRATSYVYQLEYALGLEPLDAAFIPFASGGSTTGRDGQLGVLPLSTIAALLPGAAQGISPVDPYQYSFTVRLRVIDNLGNRGEDRKTLFAFHDPSLHAGWPKFIDTGGESSMRIADLNGDGVSEIVTANSSGEVAVWNGDGSPSSYFNHGRPFLAPAPANVSRHLRAPAIASGAVQPGRGGFTTPAIDDLTGDGLPEIVVANGDKVYAFRGNGKLLPGFPVAINPAFSAPALRSKTNHVKTGIFSSPVLADLDGDRRLDIVVSAMDQHAYAWNAKGRLLPGWPVLLQDPDAATPAGAESINTPAIADIDGDGYLDVIVPTNEIYKAGAPAPNPEDFSDALHKGALDLASGAAGLVSSRVYAIRYNGTAADGDPSDNSGFVVDRDAFLPGWPAKLNGVADILPLIGPGFDPVVADVDGGTPEVIIGSTLGEMVVLGGDGHAKFNLNSSGAGGNISPGTTFHLFEYPAVGDTTGLGNLGIFKGGLPVEGLVNLVAVGQNIPFNHVVQGWDARTGQSLPGWPRATDDWQLLSSPSIANVGGGPEREVIVGTGLYLLHAYQPDGLEPPGFPKFTGGWLSGVTPIGDIDGDGLLEIANWTREGNMFVWDTNVSACDGVNEWPGFRHDDRNSGVYGSDATSPGPIRDLSFTSVPLTGVSAMHWKAPGDDGFCGHADHYEVRSSNQPITEDNWDSAQLLGTPPGGSSGSDESFVLPLFGPATYYLGVRAVDEAGNAGPVSTLP